MSSRSAGRSQTAISKLRQWSGANTSGRAHSPRWFARRDLEPRPTKSIALGGWTVRRRAGARTTRPPSRVLCPHASRIGGATGWETRPWQGIRHRVREAEITIPSWFFGEVSRDLESANGDSVVQRSLGGQMVRSDFGPANGNDVLYRSHIKD